MSEKVIVSYIAFLHKRLEHFKSQADREHILDLIFDETARIKKVNNKAEMINAHSILKTIYEKDYEQT
tara:strand:+ start:265 stop:468 length:204 start_codon:yes stop_codon:yes gene_type:complete